MIGLTNIRGKNHASAIRTLQSTTSTQSRSVSSSSCLDVPTFEEVTKLYSLLESTEDLARQINYPLTGLLWTALIQGVNFIVGENNIEKFVNYLFDIESDYLKIPVILSVLTFFLYYFKSSWDFTSNSLLKIFPNGVSIERTRHFESQLKYKLTTGSEVRQAINTLEKLIQTQATHKRWIGYFTFGFCFVFPIARAAYKGFSISPVLSRKGIPTSSRLTFVPPIISLRGLPMPFLTFFHPDENHLPISNFSNLVYKQQGINFLKFIYNIYHNIKLPSDLKTFSERLKKASCASVIWEQKVFRGSEKSSVFVLKKADIYSFRSQDGVEHSLSKLGYLSEMYRILLEEKFPVYITADERLYIGYKSLSEKKSRQIKAKLLSRLLHVEQQEKNTEKILDALNVLNNMIGSKKKWDCYSIFAGSIPKTHFYIAENAMPVSIKDDYLSCLTEVFSHDAIELNNGILTLKKCSWDNKKFELAKQKLQEVIQKLIKATRDSSQTTDSTAFTEVLSSKKVKKGLAAAAASAAVPSDEEKTGLSISSSIAYPDSIHFSRGSFVFELSLLRERSKPDNYAYPIRVPWLPEGCAFAVLDPELMDTPHFTRDRLIQLLDVGHVLSGRGIDKTKEGAVGIKSTNEPYKNTHGQNFTAASFKLKLLNNIRIMGRELEKQRINGKDRILYIFDGPGFGH